MAAFPLHNGIARSCQCGQRHVRLGPDRRQIIFINNAGQVLLVLIKPAAGNQVPLRQSGHREGFWFHLKLRHHMQVLIRMSSQIINIPDNKRPVGAHDVFIIRQKVQFSQIGVQRL